MTALTPRLRGLLVAALAVSSLAVAAPAPAQPAPADIGPTTFSGPGPYAVGERTVTLPSGVPVEVWYPAAKKDVRGKPEATYDVADWLPEILQQDGLSVTYPSGGVRGVPVRSGTYPLVVFSHGYAGFRTQSSALTAAIASWGFVVAAPDHPSRDLTKVLLGPAGTTTDLQDLRQTITFVGKKTQAKKGWLSHHVDMRRIGALGHSAGGRAVEELAVADKRVDTFIGMAGASAGGLDDTATAPDKPGLLLAASDDGIVTLDRMEAAYAAMQSPKRFVLVQGAGHLVFSDLCEIGSSGGGLLALAAAAGITIPDALKPLATDGCQDTALEPTLAWPAIQQVVIAQLRHQLGVDPTESGLAGLTDAYPGILSDSRVG